MQKVPARRLPVEHVVHFVADQQQRNRCDDAGRMDDAMADLDMQVYHKLHEEENWDGHFVGKGGEDYGYKPK